MFTGFVNCMEVNFKARHIAVTQNKFKNVLTKIDIYELSKRDKNFLENLKQSVNISAMMPELSEYSSKRWQKVFDYGVQNALLPDYKSYIAVTQNKPCCLLTCIKNGNILTLDSICDIPVNKNKRANFAGSTLFCELFKFADELKAKAIELFAVTDGEFDVITKYKGKGFKEVGAQNGYIKMSCNKFKIKEQLSDLLSKITYKPVNKSQEIDLNGLIF